MRRHDVNLTSLVLRCFLIIQISPIVLSCIYLLNGWTPMSVYNRTSKADIVLSAHVITAYKDPEFRTPALTYTATVKLIDVYKGHKLLRTIPVDENQPYVYNVSNFGDRKMCYADVSDGRNYILFLTTYKQRLSAKYDDIFGATSKFTEYNVQEVKSKLGEDLSDWTVWSSCSRACAGGYQMRKRNCKSSSEDCEQDTMEKRTCNVFSCEDSRDLLTALGVYELPLGVYHSAERPGAFNITRVAKLFSLLSNVFPEHLPHNFSILMSIKLPLNFSGYVFTLSDLVGKQRLAVKFSFSFNENAERSALIFEYSDSVTKLSTSAKFEIGTSGGEWHQYGMSVTPERVQLHVDCQAVQTEKIDPPLRTHVSSNVMMSLGPYFAQFGDPFQGEIEQLVIIDDATAAERQCVTDIGVTDIAIKDEGDNNIDRTNTEDPNPSQGEERQELSDIPGSSQQVEWTEWSPCSRTCGRGVQKRTLYCGNDLISTCSPDGRDDVQARWCYQGSCTVKCQPRCENGGTCTSNGTCACTDGYTGSTCLIPACNPQCLNGGRCISPGKCACPVGFTGKFCETAVCDPPCSNGGRCLQPGYCACPYGYMPPNCEPICLLPCRNGGRCKRFDKCVCKKGYTGRDCSIPVCRRDCLHGGYCVAPNKCTCARGYIGSRCQKPVCNPACQNDGRCLYPGICKCRRGYGGALCDTVVCRRPCQNGGTCSENNTCTCPDGYRGRWCHKKNKPKNKCHTTCLNGGKCRKKRCRCAAGFTGSKCEKRTRYALSTKSVYRPAYRCI